MQWLNADAVREKFNDWDFTEEGRLRQSIRMKALADETAADITIADFVAPLEQMRANYSADWTIWVDTIEQGRYEDTNKMFVKPARYDVRVTEQACEKWASVIVNKMGVGGKMFNWAKPTTQMLGRWQPWHSGHTALFKKAILETGQVCIMIRDVGGIVGSDAGAGRTAAQDDNPFLADDVKQGIISALTAEGFMHEEDYIVMLAPNIVDISYGRGVGYTFTQHDLGEEIHNISATKIRNMLREQGKL